MRGRKRDQFVVMQYLSDGIGVAGGLMLSWWLRFLSGIDPAAVVAQNVDYVMQFWYAFFIWMACLYFSGSIARHPRVISFNRARRILYASIIASLIIAVRNYFFRDYDVARLLYPAAFVLVSAVVITNRFLIQYIITRFLINSGSQCRALIVGTGPVALRLAARFKTFRDMGYELIGFVSLDETRVGQSVGGVPILGSKDDLRRLIRDNDVEEVFVCQTDIPNDTFFQLFIDSEKEWARVNFVPSLVEMMRSQIHYDEVAGVPIYSIRETPLQGSNATIKRAFDIIVAGTGFIIISPVLMAIAVIVKRTSPGPVLYKQTRLGLDGREFKIYKFRTMPVDAERDGPNWGTQEDPRSTRPGRFLRRWNLDELPQLWNVIRGDMSLVGPRPERPWYVDNFREVIPRYTSRHAVKTGMTGWAQVHGLRGDTSIQQRVRYDLYYIENWSLWLDIKILIMTFFRPRRRRAARRAMRSQSMQMLPMLQADLNEQSEKARKEREVSGSAVEGRVG